MSVPRVLLGAVGVVVASYGAFRLLELGVANLVATTVWAGGGVLVHDGLLAPVVVLLGVVLVRWLPAPWRAPAVVAGILWGSLTLVALPVLGRFGARADNSTLLDRPYLASWSLLTLALLATVVVAGAVRSRGRHVTPGATRDVARGVTVERVKEG